MMRDQQLTEAQSNELKKYPHAYKQPKYRMSEKRAHSIRITFEELPYRDSYLDVSCGRGEMLRFARELGFRYVAGTEVVPALIGGDVVYALAWDLPFGSGSFEVVSFLDVVEHLLPGDDERACRELGRVATHSILITANNLPSPLKPEKRVDLHVNKRPYEEWDALFREWFAGYTVTWLKDRVANKSELWRMDRR